MPPRRPRDTRTGDLFDSSPGVGAPAPDAGMRTMIEELIARTELDSTSAEYHQLLTFVARMRRFAPFNAMLLHIQKPDLTHAATRPDWLYRFSRTPKRHARPLLVCAPWVRSTLSSTFSTPRAATCPSTPSPSRP